MNYLQDSILGFITLQGQLENKPMTFEQFSSISYLELYVQTICLAATTEEE